MHEIVGVVLFLFQYTTLLVLKSTQYAGFLDTGHILDHIVKSKDISQPSGELSASDHHTMKFPHFATFYAKCVKVIGGQIGMKISKIVNS